MKIIDTISRVFVERDELDKTIQFYENLYQEDCKLHFVYDEMNLELAQVDRILILAGDSESRSPFEATKVTLLVDSIQEAEAFLLQHGATILIKPQEVPTGWNMMAKHPDGLLVEYVSLVQQSEDLDSQ